MTPLGIAYPKADILVKTYFAMAQRLVAGLPARRPGLDRKLVHVGFVVDKVAMGQICLRGLRSSPSNITPQMFHTHIYFTYN
jgi:hypothetical protein